MHDDMRVSDADREQVAERLREHFAVGRLTSEELDQRVAAALSAKTVRDLRVIMADLPEPAPAGRQSRQESAYLAERPAYGYRRGPGVLPLVLIVLLAVIVLPSAGVFFVAFLKLILLFWLVACVAGVFTAVRFRRRARRYWQSRRRNWYYGDHR